MKTAQHFWEEKARFYKRDIRGVLFGKLYPGFVIHGFHRWTVHQIRQDIDKKKKVKALDAGCGYGRISRPLLKTFPNLEVRGVDISRSYVDLFNTDLAPRGKALVADIRKLPFGDGSFDLVFMVATLMYVEQKSEQKQAMDELMRVLKKNGKLIAIERTPLMEIFDFFKRLRLKGKGGGRSFTKKEVFDLIKKTGGKLVKAEGWPTDLLPLFLAYKAVKL